MAGGGRSEAVAAAEFAGGPPSGAPTVTEADGVAPAESAPSPTGQALATPAGSRDRGPLSILVVMLLVYGAGFGWLTWLQQSNYGTWDFDMGVFDQEIWLAAHHLNPFITIRGLNMWANHVNPIVYLLVPFYWLGAGPHFLYIVQMLAFMAGAVALWVLARDRFANAWLALAIPAAWLLYPAVEWMTWWHFHPESLGVPALLFAYLAADRRRWGWFALCVVLVLACKEDAALPVIALGVVLVVRRQWKAGALTAAGAAAWMALCLTVIMPAASGTSVPFFVSQYPTLGNSAGAVLFNAVRHPSRVWSLALRHDRWEYYKQLFVPVAGVAALAPLTLLLALPTLLVNVTNDQGYPHDIRYQYGAFVSAGIFLATVEAIGRFRRQAVRIVISAAVLAGAVGSNMVWSPSPLDQKQYAGGIWVLSANAQVATLNAMVASVPASAGVSASYSVVPHLSHRDQIYSWPNPWERVNYGISATQPPETPTRIRYLVIDLLENSPQQGQLLSELTGPRGPFRIVEDQNEAVLAVRRTASSTAPRADTAPVIRGATPSSASGG